MQKNKTLTFLIFFFYEFLLFGNSNQYFHLDREPLYCKSKNLNNSIFLILNDNRIFNLEIYNNENKKIIHDEYFQIKNNSELGSPFIYKDGKLFWKKNPWNGFYQFSFDLKENELEQRYVLKKNKISNFFSTFLNNSDFYLKTNKFTCTILNNWKELEDKMYEKK